MIAQARFLTKQSAVKAIARRGAATLPLWSETLSFASPEADFTRSQRDYATSTSSESPSTSWSGTLAYSSPEYFHTEHQAQPVKSTWSNQLSYSSPESDFTFDAAAATSDAPTTAPEWSHALSFASPESDFVSSQQDENFAQDYDRESSDNSYAFGMASSPETAFGSIAMQELVDDRLKRPLRLNDRERSDDSFSFAMASSPETAFGSVAMQELLDDRMKHPLRFNDREGSDDFYAFAMASSPETAFGGVAMQELLDDRMKHQLQQVLESQRAAQTKKQEEEEAIQAVLPKTLAEAMIEEDRRAIVVTTATAPFEIIHVNNAWVGLCGFSKGEALHNTLNLLQGPQTNRRHAQHLLHELQHGHAASAVITNYTKQGRPFKNLVRVAPIRDDSRRISYFVGVLEEIVNQAQRDDHDGRHMMRAA